MNIDVKPATAAENVKLARRIQAGDQKARTEMIQRNLPIAAQQSASLRSLIPAEVPFDDILAEAMLLIVSYVDRYDPEQGSFSTYAISSLRAQLPRAFQRYTGAGSMRITDWMRGNRYTGMVERARSLGVATDPESIAQFYGASLEYCQQGERLRTMPLPEPLEVIEDGGGRVGELTSRLDGADVQASVESAAQTAKLKEVIKTLPSDEAQVIDGRFIQRRTLRSVGDEMGLTRIEVRKLERSALQRMAEDFPSDLAA